MLKARRTLVKSCPELWAEVSDPDALGAHLAAFGPIRITRTAEASLVEWEGERASGRLELAPAGFGTRVVLEAEVACCEPTSPAQGWWARHFRPPPGAGVPVIADDEAVAALTATLDALGGARHRPFSRS